MGLIQDMASLGRRIASYTKTPITKVLEGMREDSKRYYGEITFTTANTGVSIIHRIWVNENNMPYLGNIAQQNLIQNLQSFLVQMSLARDRVSIANYYQKINELEQRYTNAKSVIDKSNIEQQIIKNKRTRITIVNADERLRQCIINARTLYSVIFPKHKFGITASANAFFSNKDKDAVRRYGAQIADMENQLFLLIIHYSITSNKIFIANEFVTKIATHPFIIEPEVTTKLNIWASNYSLSIDDYVQAFIWAYNGQNFTDFPINGRWTIAEQLTHCG